MGAPVQVLTVATLDYVPQALGLLASVRRTQKDATPHLFVIDATPETRAQLDAALSDGWDWVNWFAPADLTAHQSLIEAAFEYYNGIEISCLAKYVGLRNLLETGGGSPVALFDSDILLMGPLDRPRSELGERALLLTPHALGPGEASMEHEYLLHGWVNAGFMMANPDERSLKIMDWLIDRISHRGFLAPEYGLSCDQTWVSALPVAFHDDIVLSRDPGLNVAYWNLPERPLTRDGEQILAAGQPLTFFHLSGFDPARPDTLSAHFGVPIVPGGVVAGLAEAYTAQLREAEGVRGKLNGLPRRPVCRAPLAERIEIGATRHGIGMRSPTIRPGFLSKIAAKLESRLLRG
ncbi:MAG: hypothetical protein JJ969_05515 [Rhizobiaceae bacterium]|nr:hypothetical protein [Rhizobiaceae bacterium]